MKKPFYGIPGASWLTGYAFGQGGRPYVAQRHNLTAVVDPTAADNAGEGYRVGSLWVNRAAKTAFICTDVSDSSVTWQPVPTSGGGGGGGDVSGILKGDGTGTISAASPGVDYLTPNGSGADLTDVVKLEGAQRVPGYKTFVSGFASEGGFYLVDPDGFFNPVSFTPTFRAIQHVGANGFVIRAEAGSTKMETPDGSDVLNISDSVFDLLGSGEEKSIDVWNRQAFNGSGNSTINWNTRALTGGGWAINGSDGTSAAAAGDVGQVITASRTNAAATMLESDMPTACLSIALTPGDWDVDGVVTGVTGDMSSGDFYKVSGKLTSGGPSEFGDDGTIVHSLFKTQSPQTAEPASVTLPRKVFRVTANTTVYAVIACQFNGDGGKMYGSMTARRIR